MRIAIDPHMHRHLSLEALPHKVKELGFDGVMTSCVFAWEDKADSSGKFMRAEMQRYVDGHWGE